VSTVEFPSEEKDLPPKGGSAATARVSTHSGPLRFLVVDDDPGMREVISEYLQIDGHRVDTAGDGEQALRLCAVGDYDVVITDRAMAGMNGLELAGLMKADRPDRPVILLTGFAGVMHDDVPPQPASVDLVLAKPLSLSQLREAVRRVVSEGGPQ
jgi:CheY-like chemotaxis protein